MKKRNSSFPIPVNQGEREGERGIEREREKFVTKFRDMSAGSAADLNQITYTLLGVC